MTDVNQETTQYECEIARERVSLKAVWFITFVVAGSIGLLLGLIGRASAQTLDGGPDYATIVRMVDPGDPPPIDLDAIAKLRVKLGEVVVIDDEYVTNSPDLSIWLRLKECEWGSRPWHGYRTTGNHFYGAFQWALSTWRSLGTGYDFPDQAPIDVQIDAARRNLARSSWQQQWPGCSKKLGLQLKERNEALATLYDLAA